MRDIRRYVIRKYDADWKDVGRELNLNHERLTVIEANHSFNNAESFYSMINKWISTDYNPTWKALEVALTNVNRGKLGLDPVDDVYGIITHRINLMKTTKLVADIA